MIRKPIKINTSLAVAVSVVILLLTSGCTTSAVFWDGHRAYPKKPRFSIIPREYSAEELAAAGIRTDGVYIRIGWRPQELQEREEAQMREKGWRTGSPFYRFWANGRFMARLDNIDRNLFSAEHADSFTRARMGYFRITSNGIVISEVYAFDSGKGDYNYFTSTHQIEGATMWKDYGYGEKYKGEAVQLGHRFIPIPGMKAQPDW